jgi:DNA-binding XRE family transcriptional regulator
MSKAKELIKEILEKPSGAGVRPVRTTRFFPKEDGSVVRRVMDAAGGLVSEETLSPERRLSLDARTRLGMTQKNFASLLGISVRTLHDWEQGRREPSGAARTLLKIASRYPEMVKEVAGQ